MRIRMLGQLLQANVCRRDVLCHFSRRFIQNLLLILTMKFVHASAIIKHMNIQMLGQDIMPIFRPCMVLYVLSYFSSWTASFYVYLFFYICPATPVCLGFQIRSY